jgi:sterol desaturase/sphingolipid hydroxylase (fatty acid hydroxylase superfamily)
MKKIPWHYDHHMNANQDANWCVTKPWFDYLLGTRVISAANLQEQNPLGIALPQGVAKRLNQVAQRYFPAKWVEKNNMVTGLALKTEANEAVQQQDSVAMVQ